MNGVGMLIIMCKLRILGVSLRVSAVFLAVKVHVSLNVCKIESL